MFNRELKDRVSQLGDEVDTLWEMMRELQESFSLPLTTDLSRILYTEDKIPLKEAVELILKELQLEIKKNPSVPSHFALYSTSSTKKYMEGKKDE